MDLFAQKTWENYDAAGLSRERLETIEQLIPSGVQTVLDAGCGNGAITNTLAQRYQVTGLDFSPASLEHVPTAKILASGLVRCANCGHVFHAYGHLQSFVLARLDALTNLRRMDFRVLGPRQRSFYPALLRFRQHQLGQWFKPDFALSCPHCGGSEFLAKKSILTKTVNACGRLGRPSRPYWLMALYAVSESRKAAK